MIRLSRLSNVSVYSWLTRTVYVTLYLFGVSLAPGFELFIFSGQIYTRPRAASLIVTFPAAMSLHVCKISVQSLNVTKGTFSFSQ